MNSDDRLVELVIDGDDMAFELLYARHVADALAFADGLLGSREEAEQAVRHSFAAAHAYLADGGRKTAFEPWLYTILDNHCLSVLERRRGGAPAPEGEAATVVDLEEWRRRRKLMGGALPLAPSAGFHDSVMTACGIGGGAASVAAAPLLGGTLAKVAVVAVLAAGAGVAGNAVTERGGAGDGAHAPPAAVVDSSATSSAATGLLSKLTPPAARADGSERPEWAPERDPRAQRDAVAPEEAPPATSPPAAVAVGQPPAVPASTPPSRASIPGPAPVAVGDPPADAPAALPQIDDGSKALRRLGDRVKQGLPNLADRLKAHLPKVDKPPAVKPPKPPPVVDAPKVELPKVVKPPKLKLPDVVELPKIGDDEGVPDARVLG